MPSHVFISYSNKDRGSVTRIASDLAALGVMVWWDQWEIKVGDSLYNKIEQGIQEAAWLCIALSPNSVNSSWVQKELNVALERELQERRVFVLPLLLEPCKIPLFLSDKAYADFTSSYENGFKALVDRVSPRLDPAICASLADEDDARVERAALSIEPKAVAPYVSWLSTRLTSEIAAERRSSLVALNSLKPNGLLGYLAITAKDSNPSIRMLSTLCLEQMNTDASVQVLQELTQDPIAFVRASARNVLKRMKKW